MSLINEALKKAQKVRTGDTPAELSPLAGAGSPPFSPAQPRSAQTILMLAAGGALLIVVSVAITFWLVNRPPVEKATAAPIAAKPVPAASATPAPAPAKLTPPAVTKADPPVASPSAAAKTGAPVLPASSKTSTPVPPSLAVARAPAAQPVSPAAVTEAPPAAAPATPDVAQAESAPDRAPELSAPPPKGDERVHAFVDSIKVAGIRPSGNDSRVLMNDHVYRVNDIVERTLGVRLTKVESDSLTFTDGNGAVYVKNF